MTATDDCRNAWDDDAEAHRPSVFDQVASLKLDKAYYEEGHERDRLEIESLRAEVERLHDTIKKISDLAGKVTL